MGGTRKIARDFAPLTQETIVPSKSRAQAKLMRAAAHNPEFAAKANIPVEVAREFNNADKARSADYRRATVNALRRNKR